MRIETVSYAQILSAANAKELMREYAAECALEEMGEACPQQEMYEAMEESSRFRCFGAYEGETLAGFAAVLTYVVPHYGRKAATVESLFVAKAYRHTGAGRGLMSAIEQFARTRNCRAVLYSAPAGGQLEELLWAMKAYRHSHTVFLRGL